MHGEKTSFYTVMPDSRVTALLSLDFKTNLRNSINYLRARRTTCLSNDLLTIYSQKA